MEILVQHLGKGLGLMLMISLPCVLTAAGVGLIVGILQAVTQVQEQTIAAAPKIISVFTIIILGGGLMMNMLTDYIRESAAIAFNEVPQDGKMLLPPRTRDPKRQRVQHFFREQLGTDAEGAFQRLESTSNRPIKDGANAGSGSRIFSGNYKHGSAQGTAEQMQLDSDRRR